MRHRLPLLTAKPSAENLVALRELAEAGEVAPVIDRAYPLSEVPEAIRHLEGEHTRAKIVITVRWEGMPSRHIQGLKPSSRGQPGDDDEHSRGLANRSDRIATD